MGKLLLGLIVAGLLAMMSALPQLSAPPALRSATPVSGFDAVRARDRLAQVLGDEAPHPADTAASDPVRARLVGQLRAMGLEPRVDDRFTCNNLHKQRGVSCARVRNVIATIGVGRPGKHLLINSHYDSVPVGPGASDAGLGVATMLEVAGLLKDRPLARPVTLLFNEGEELGLIGARAFLDGDPLAGQVDSLINLEARGTTGPVNMFETSLPNAAPVRLFADTVSAPVASSLAVSAYRQIPNYTDVNSFEERGWLTLNFAPIGNETRYHSPGDDVQALDLATLQHMGDQTLALAAKLGGGPAPAQSSGEWLFMTVPLLGLFILPMWSGIAAAALIGGLLLVAVARRRAWAAVALMLASILTAALLAYAGLSVIGMLREGQFWRGYPQASELAIYAGVIVAGLAALGLARRIEAGQWRAAFWLLYLLLGAALSGVASGALIYFLLPPAMFVLGLLLSHWWRRGEVVLGIAAGLVALLTLGAMLGLLEDLLNGGPLWLFAIFGSLVLLPLLIEARPLLLQIKRRELMFALVSLAALAWLPAALAPAYSADRQQQWTLQYIVDPTQRQPLWSVVNDRKALPDEWRRLGDWRAATLPGLDRRQRWVAPAPPVAGIQPPSISGLEVTAFPGGRRVRLRLTARGADSLLLTASDTAQVRALGVPGQVRAIGKEGSGPYRLSCTGRACEGRVMELRVGSEPVDLTLVATRWSLPTQAAPLRAARPAFARPQYLPNATLIVQRIRI